PPSTTTTPPSGSPTIPPIRKKAGPSASSARPSTRSGSGATCHGRTISRARAGDSTIRTPALSRETARSAAGTSVPGSSARHPYEIFLQLEEIGLLAASSGLMEGELALHEVDDGDEVAGGAVAAGPGLGGLDEGG